MLRKDWAGNNSVKWRTDTGFTNELHACIISSGTQGLEASGYHGFFIFHFTKYNIEGLFRHLVPQATLHLIYQALIQPHFDYCNIVWGICGRTLQNKIQKLQNRAARVLTNSNYDADAGHLFELLRWKNLASQQHIQIATMVYKSLHGLAPDYLCSKFERRETAYNLRDSENKLNVPLPRTNYYKNSFSYSGATLWNSLPRDIRQAGSLGLFKRLIKEVR